MTELKYKVGDKVWVPVEVDRVNKNEILVTSNEYPDHYHTIHKELLDKAIPLPVIPRFVADWIEYCKGKYLALHGAYEVTTKENSKVTAWRFKNGNSNLFALAWIFGYEVEQEKKYWVRDKEGKSLLHRYGSLYLERSTGHTKEHQEEYREKYTFTEQEIKNHDERYWAFAVEVEE